MQKGIVLVVSAPSGAGKTTLCRALIDRWPGLRGSISCTTRPPRPGEVHGHDYFFLSEAEFTKLRDESGLLEWAHVHGHSYGTPRGPIEENLRQGFDVVLNIEWHGAASVKEIYPESLRVYVCPPAWAELEKRLRGRGQDDETIIQKRLAAAREVMSHLQHYDYLVVNQDLGEAVEDLSAILRAEHRRRSRMGEALERLGLNVS